MSSHEQARAGSQDLRGKTALVTGAGKRIGRAIAVALAEEGADIVVHDRRGLEQETLRVCGEVKECGTRSWQVLGDLEKPEEYESLIVQAQRVAGKLDFLVNNAAIFLPTPLGEMSFGDVARHLHINAWAPFLLAREFNRLSDRGKIVNLLDTRITGHDRAHAAYVLSKRMLAELTAMCALEFAPDFTVNGIAPGLILPPPGRDEAYLDSLVEQVPLRKHGDPGDVAAAVVFLLKSDFVTGQVIYVDGGSHLGKERHGPDRDH